MDLQKPLISRNVREIVQYVLQKGDLVSVFSGPSRAVLGTKLHQQIQKARPENYQKEVTVKYLHDTHSFTLEIQGRIDGVSDTPEIAIIEEIKSTTRNLDHISEANHSVHWGQGKLYAFIWMKNKHLEKVKLQMTYINIETRKIKQFEEEYSLSQLEEFFNYLMEVYCTWMEKVFNWQQIRNSSIEELSFPYPDYRLGQKRLAVGVYKTILSKKNLMIQAPTGIGKTLAVIFPALKTIKTMDIKKIFYLTAKTIGRKVVEETCELMRHNGLKLKTIYLTAKEKICFNDHVSCHPDDCPYAVQFYDKVNKAVEELFRYESINRDVIETVARNFNICPFEMSLDASLSMDMVVGDYNYVFDPGAGLKRYFQEVFERYVFLVDESHNLPDRAREMYSSSLNKKTFMILRKEVKTLSPKLYKTLGSINKYLMLKRKELELNSVFHIAEPDQPDDFSKLLRIFAAETEAILTGKRLRKDYELMNVYFDVLNYLRISELYDNHFVTCYEPVGSDLKIKLFCLDPSSLLAEVCSNAVSTIFFSASLLPETYFRKMLGVEDDTLFLELQSPFPRQNFELLVADRISTRYRDRDNSVDEVAAYIHEFVSQRKGNYMVYFPSYKYLTKVSDVFRITFPEKSIVIQNTAMSEVERENFLNLFCHQEEILAFVVMGGIFGEGIDLTGDKLIGAVVVGVGLPQLCYERDLIKDYFEKTLKKGYEFAYQFPGMNKVIQAVGRIIRTDTDRGATLLIDERFSYSTYKKIFPGHWKNHLIVRNHKMLSDQLSIFWSDRVKKHN